MTMMVYLYNITAVAVIAIGVRFLAQKTQMPPSFKTQSCSSNSDEPFPLYFSAESRLGETGWDLPVEGENPVSEILLDPCHVFSASYREARQKFRQAATKAGATLHSLNVPVPPEKVLEDLVLSDDDSIHGYTIDIAVIPGTGDGLLVHTAGVHGVEAYAGSPVQVAFLESIYPRVKEEDALQKQPLELPTIVLIHAVNPYGMAHYRRTNENNVDLNRNGLHIDEWTSSVLVTAMDSNALLNQQDTNKSPYEAYAHLTSYFNPQGPPSWLYLFVTVWTNMGEALIRHGFDALKAALVTGQYFDPRGIFYGGQELQPSLRLIWDFFAETLLVENTEDVKESDNKPCCTGTVTWIDVHTGLGVSGEDTLLTDWLASSKVASQAPKWFPGSRTPLASKDAKKVSKGYDNARGFTTAFFRRLFESRDLLSSSYLAVAQEFGTIPSILVAHALILENRAFNFLPPVQSVEWAKQTTKRAFYKETPEWRRQILERGLTLMLQGIRRSTAADA